MQSSTNQTPDSDSYLKSIHGKALEHLRSMRDKKQISATHYDLIANTRKPDEIKAVVEASQTRSRAADLVWKAAEPLLARLDVYGPAMDAIAGAAPQLMGVNVVGLVWGSIKFVLVTARDVSDSITTICDFFNKLSGILLINEIYVEMFAASRIQLLRAPLIEMYTHLMLFGVRAVELASRSRARAFWGSIWSSPSKVFSGLTEQIAQARQEIDRVAHVEHMRQTSEASNAQAAANEQVLSQLKGMNAQPKNPSVTVKRLNTAPIVFISDHFTGRDSELETITRTVNSWKSDKPALFAIHGDPGRGKSQLALQYAHLSFESGKYTHIFWASATTEEKTTQALANVLDLVDHKDRHHPEQTVRLMAARLWLENANQHGCPSWLFIFDNVTWATVKFLLEHLPSQNGQGTILVTTRTLDIAEHVTNAVKQKQSFLELLPLSVGQSVKLLLARAGLDNSAAVHQGDLEKFVKKFGCLPLAVEQAGAYIKQKHTHLDKVRNPDMLRDIISWENTRQTAYEQNSVSAVFDIQLQTLGTISADASNLLKTVAFLDPEIIPLDILTRGAERVQLRLKEKSLSPEESLAPTTHHGVNCDGSSDSAPSLASGLDHLIELMRSEDWLLEAVGYFEDLSLAQALYGDNPSLHMHDLNQLVLQEQIAASDQEQTYYALAVTLLASAFKTITDNGSPQSWAECERFVPHLMSLEKHRPTKASPSKEFMDMSQDIARYFRKRGRYSEAETLLIRVLAQREAVYGLGVDHLDTLTTVHYLARLCIDQGQYDQADAFYARALTGRKKQLGIDHLDTLMTMHDLALLRFRQGQYDHAEELFTPVLAGQEKQLGPEHLDTLETAENLANMYENQGKYNMANTLYARVLAGREEQLGPEHPDTITTMSNLGVLYHGQGKYDEAEPLLARVLRSSETQLGEEHPDTLSMVHDLARLYLDQGKYDEAETMYARVLTGEEKQLGAEHPDTLITVHNFAFLRKRQGRWEEAEVLYRRALAGEVKARGDIHPETRATMENLAYLYEARGRNEEAEALRARFREVEQMA
ncbi:hypothetical protein HWV62_19289 [Athelia sp. TMB]|nr:hypothetical protein HWV62_19289 [Athelia sp. TMB]